MTDIADHFNTGQTLLRRLENSLGPEDPLSPGGGGVERLRVLRARIVNGADFGELCRLHSADADSAAKAITDMVVRGAPAIGVTANA